MLVYANSGSTIHLGRVGENLATEVVFNISKWFKEYGKGIVELVVQKDGETYPQLSETVLHYQLLSTKPVDWETSWFNYYELNNDIYLPLYGDGAPNWETNKYYNIDNAEVIWRVTESNTINAGMGKCELFFFKDDVLIKSAIYDTIVTNALDYEEGSEPPEPSASWVSNVLEVAAELKTNLEDIDGVVELARDWAIGPNNAEVEDTPTEQNNAWYYSVQSANNATIAKDWAEGLNEETDNYSARYHASLAESRANEAADSATKSSDKAKESEENVILSRQWAIGLTDDGEVPSDENNARVYAKDAANSASLANQKAEEATTSASAAQDAYNQIIPLKDAAEGAVVSAIHAQEAAEHNATLAKNWATGPADNSEEPTETNNAKYYAELAANVSEHPPRIGLLEENENPDYWYIWNKETNNYEQTNYKVRFSIVAVYSSIEEMNQSTNHEVGDFVVVSNPFDESDAMLYVYNGENWSKVTDLSGYEGIGIATIKYVGNNLGDTTGSTPHQPGAIDNYLITYTDGRTQTYSIYNGVSPTISVQSDPEGHTVTITDLSGIQNFRILNGTGSGDMNSAVYDPTGEILKAGGIKEYIEQAQSASICLKTWTAADFLD